MSGKWSGGIANRDWNQRDRRWMLFQDPERDARLFAEMADRMFWCPTCGGTHPLREHRACREANPFMSAVKG